jgi:ADP-dependent NAD(P)H-hydrate dehydratase / NAD(P)H-hydrate epimerase
MKIFKSEQVREIDAYTIKNEPISSINLMERASMNFVKCFVRKFDSSRPVYIFAGTGNNGGDGFAVARILASRNYKVKAFLIKFSERLSSDCEININRFKESFQEKYFEIRDANEFPELENNSIVIDAIFGSGLSRRVSGMAAELIKFMNASGTMLVSIDIPSGLFGEDNSSNDVNTIVKADYTISFEFPFLSFFFIENTEFIRSWKIVGIGLDPDAVKNTHSDYILLDDELLSSLIKPRRKYSHKGTYGHALIIAGSYGMMGASVLATHACLRGGAGLVTVHIPRYGYPIIQTTLPEALVSIDESDILFSGVSDISKYTAIGIGPGLNIRPNTVKGFHALLKKIQVPLLIDADALNILAENKSWLEELPENTVLTPHPGEFDRLFGQSMTSYERHQKQLKFAKKYKIIIVLKGAHTMIALPDGRCFINSTGNAGMATGGSGDVLTGLITSLLAQGYSSEHASIIAVYIHGLSGDLALEEQSQESLIAGDLIRFTGKAFKLVEKYQKK